jgi:myo-inositol-1(or 4)-monophosphatase
MLFYASHGKGAFIETNSRKKRIRVATHGMKDSYVLVGVNCFLSRYPVHNRLVTGLAERTRTTNSCGSCALGLGLVASGKADAFVQPVQSPWDWAAGKLLVEEAGGRIIFYTMDGGRIEPVKKLEPRHYNPDERAVGFVAGNKKIVDDIMDMLLKVRV